MSESLRQSEAVWISNPGADRGFQDTTFHIYINFVIPKDTGAWDHTAVQTWCWCVYTRPCFPLEPIIYLSSTPPLPQSCKNYHFLWWEMPHDSSVVHSYLLQWVNKPDSVRLQVCLWSFEADWTKTDGQWVVGFLGKNCSLKKHQGKTLSEGKGTEPVRFGLFGVVL